MPTILHRKWSKPCIRLLKIWASRVGKYLNHLWASATSLEVCPMKSRKIPSFSELNLTISRAELLRKFIPMRTFRSRALKKPSSPMISLMWQSEMCLSEISGLRTKSMTRKISVYTITSLPRLLTRFVQMA